MLELHFRLVDTTGTIWFVTYYFSYVDSVATLTTFPVYGWYMKDAAAEIADVGGIKLFSVVTS